jgi:hypothetical protein
MAAHRYQLALLAIAMVLGPSCGSGQIIDDSCFVELAEVKPLSVTLNVGDTLTFSAGITGPQKCLPPGVTFTSQLRWRTAYPAIAKIDSLTGRLTAEAVGRSGVIVSALGSSSSQDLGTAIVEVR